MAPFLSSHGFFKSHHTPKKNNFVLLYVLCVLMMWSDWGEATTRSLMTVALSPVRYAVQVVMSRYQPPLGCP